MNRRIGVAFVASTVTLLISVSAAMLHTSERIGYRIGFLTTVPIAVWVAIAISVAIFGIWSILFSRPSDNRILVIISAMIVAISSTIPNLRFDVKYERFDSWFHVGASIDILRTGSVFPSDFYPALHILGAESGLICQTEISMFYEIMSPIIAVFGVLLYFSISKRIFRNHYARWVSTIGGMIAFCIIPTTYPYPVALSLALMAILATILVSNATDRRAPMILYLTTALALVVTHIFLSILLALALALLVYPSRRPALQAERRARSTGVWGRAPFALFFQTLAIYCAGWLLFYSPEVFGQNAEVVAAYMRNPTPVSEDYLSIMEGVGVVGLASLILILKLEIGRAFLLSVSLFSLHAMLRSRKVKDSEKKTLELFIVPIVAFFLLALILGTTLAIFEWGPDRFLAFGFLIVPFVCGYAVKMKDWKTMSRSLSVAGLGRNLGRLTFAALTITVMYLSLMAAFPSTYVSWFSEQTTAQDLAGDVWFYENRNQSNGIACATYHAFITSGVFGVSSTLDAGYDFRASLPEHLVLTEAQQQASGVSYILITEFDIQVMERRGDLYRSDVSLVSGNASYNTIYSNGEFLVMTWRHSSG